MLGLMAKLPLMVVEPVLLTELAAITVNLAALLKGGQMFALVVATAKHRRTRKDRLSAILCRRFLLTILLLKNEMRILFIDRISLLVVHRPFLSNYKGKQMK
jgi:hypothetical protein